MFVLFITGILIIWCIAEAFTTGLAVWHAATLILLTLAIMYKNVYDKLETKK